MAFSPIDLPIQEILQTDFIVDIAQIHNSNVLLLKDKIEDLINTFEVDINTVSIGVDSPINNIKTQNIVIQDGGWILQTGIPNQVIASLSKNVNDLSVLKVDYLNVDFDISADSIESVSLTSTGTFTAEGPGVFEDSLSYQASLIESKETISATLEFDGVDKAEARISLTSTSKKNIYVTLNAETTIGATQVWDPVGSSFAVGLTDIVLYLDLDTNSPMAQNTSFNIYLVDILENSANTSIVLQVNTASLAVEVKSGVNLSSGSSAILLHNDFDTAGLRLGINPSSTNLLSSSFSRYGANASFNYILDNLTTDRFIITAATGMEVFS